MRYLLSHVDCPNACAAAKIQYSGRNIWVDCKGRFMNFVATCYFENLVVDVHAILLILL